MRQVFKIDSSGFYIEPVILNDESTPSNCVEVVPPQGLYKLKWNGSSWVEGATQDEINAAKNPPPIVDETKKQLADLTLTLMMNGVI